MNIMNTAYLLTGSNMGERERNLYKAYALINERCGTVVKTSSLYETAAWGKEDQPAFFNQALEINTALVPRKLLKEILDIEKKIGRIREEKYGPRIIDIDILLFNDEILDEKGLKIPHPELQNRRFALCPLAEIAGNIVHPVLKKDINELLKICPDKLKVKKIEG